jgi:hypothetical protein
VLDDWSPSVGLFLYYPSQRQMPVALRALIGMLHASRGSASPKSSIENPFAAE